MERNRRQKINGTAKSKGLLTLDEKLTWVYLHVDEKELGKGNYREERLGLEQMEVMSGRCLFHNIMEK